MTPAAFEAALALVRRHPIAFAAGAAALGFLIGRARVRPTGQGRGFERRTGPERSDVPVLNVGRARVYDPDSDPAHPTHDTLDSRRDFSARA